MYHPKNSFFCLGSLDADGRRVELDGRPFFFLSPAAAAAAIFGLFASTVPGPAAGLPLRDVVE